MANTALSEGQTLRQGVFGHVWCLAPDMVVLATARALDMVL